MSLARKIKERSRALGFQMTGIARAEPLSQEREHLRAWLARGYHGTMEWMERNVDKRSDPRRILNGAKSVISVALNYYTPDRRAEEEGVGKISRYAWGDDYHHLLSRRLNELAEIVRELAPGATTKVYADTGPLMDKVWAARAGLGWQGKHTNLITRQYGSWVFLGEVLTDLELEPDRPVEDLCGTCTACIDACPTRAIVAPYQLDARLCISYQTIEHRGEIPEEIAERLEGWIFGCDVCQDVCPWNRFRQESREPAFRPRPWALRPVLTELIGLDDGAFAERFRKSALKRAKNIGLSRNARAVLRNQGAKTPPAS